jgi:heme/copper-type cytochrome/quinol oxidase subunit 2
MKKSVSKILIVVPVIIVIVLGIICFFTIREINKLRTRSIYNTIKIDNNGNVEIDGMGGSIKVTKDGEVKISGKTISASGSIKVSNTGNVEINGKTIGASGSIKVNEDDNVEIKGKDME